MVAFVKVPYECKMIKLFADTMTCDIVFSGEADDDERHEVVAAGGGRGK